MTVELPETAIPPGVRVLESGALLDVETGKFVGNTGGGKYAITSRSAHDLHAINARRKLEARLAAQSGLARTISSGKPSVLRAWSEIVEDQARLAKDTEKGRASTEAARFVADATGFSAKDAAQDHPTGQNDANLAALHVIYDLVELLRAERDGRDVVDGQVVSAE